MARTRLYRGMAADVEIPTIALDAFMPGRCYMSITHDGKMRSPEDNHSSAVGCRISCASVMLQSLQ
jgi:hypothetical protein